MRGFILRHLRIVSSRELIDDGYIRIKNGVVAELGREPIRESGGEDIILKGYTAVPGFIDTHTHGIMGLDVTLNPEAHKLLEMGRHYVKHGVTAFLPTTVSSSHETIMEACKAVKQAIEEWTPEFGSRILGIHLEGPYLNLKAAGAQNPQYIREPNVRELEQYIRVSGNNIRQITIAPEIKDAYKVITFAKSMGITVSAGHTNASYEEGIKGVELGVTKATHIFNGMTRFNHREPGIALALMQSPGVYVEIIPDFIHLHPATVKMIIDHVSPNRVVLITDSIAATDMPDGVYELGGLKLKVEHGVCKLMDAESLAGSTLTMDKVFRNIRSLGYSIIDIAVMTSLAPAKSINIGSNLKIGDISPGYKADIAILDEEYKVVKTFVEGNITYEK